MNHRETIILVLLCCLLHMHAAQALPSALRIAPAPPKTTPCPDCFVTQVCGKFAWTKWMNRDLPSGTGDWETVSDAVPMGGCAKPVWIECRTTSSPQVSWWQTGQVIRFNLDGCNCVNADQPDGNCDFDYEMRELCPI